MSSEKKPEQISLELSSDIASSSATDKGANSDLGAVLEWVSHPAKRNMKVTVAVSIFLLILIIIVYALTQSVFFTVLAFVILYASLAAFYFPTRYRLDDKGIEIKTTTQTLRKNWSQYRSFYPDKNGVLLSPFTRPTRLENFRGVYIRFGNNREDVTSFISRKFTKTPVDEGKDGI
ncbi:MAG: hypothetical protein HRF51_01930 [bacterium]|jgi:hypothetical protein